MTQEDLYVKIVVDAWNDQIKFTNKIFDQLTDEQLMNEVAPSKNRGIYLLGHLVAVHDRMLPLLRFGDELYPELFPVFVQVPDKTVANLPTIEQLKEQWQIVNQKLADHINNLPAAEWFTRHANVSEEDFAKEPHRNRLNVLISRTNHLSNHRGQIALLLPKTQE